MRSPQPGTQVIVRPVPTGDSPHPEKEASVATLLWIIAVVLVIAGILALLRRQILWGAVLIIVGLLVGPGGVSIFA